MLKHAASRELVQAIRETVAGERFVNPRLGAQLATASDGPPGGLTPENQKSSA